ncbi:MAG: FAD-dependent oxidoreductase [Geodermatophilaceae bacterium]
MPRLLVLGGGAAGMSAASAARRVDSALEIVVLEANGYAAYGMCGLPYYIGGVVDGAESLLAYPPETFRADRGLDLRLHTRATRIDPDRHSVETDHGEQIGYDALVVAAGAQPTRPPIPGTDHERVFTIRALEDSIRLRGLIDKGLVRRALVVGAGYIGLETAEALAMHGAEVEVAEALPRITMSVDTPISDVVEAELRAHVHVRLGAAVMALEPNGDGLVARLADEDLHDDTIDVDAVVLATGVRPDSQLLTTVGADHLPGGAVLVDDQMHTSIPDVFAAGDCVAHRHRILDAPAWIPLGPAANKTGRVAGTVAAGGQATFAGIVGTAVVKVFDLEVARTGLSAAEAGPGALTCDVVHRSRAKYYPDGHPLHVRLVFEPTGRLLGGQLAGRDGVAKRIDVLATALYAGLSVADLTELDLSYAPPFAPVYDPVLIAAQRAVAGLTAVSDT